MSVNPPSDSNTHFHSRHLFSTILHASTPKKDGFAPLLILYFGRFTYSKNQKNVKRKEFSKSTHFIMFLEVVFRLVEIGGLIWINNLHDFSIKLRIKHLFGLVNDRNKLPTYSSWRRLFSCLLLYIYSFLRMLPTCSLQTLALPLKSTL